MIVRLSQVKKGRTIDFLTLNTANDVYVVFFFFHFFIYIREPIIKPVNKINIVFSSLSIIIS